MKFFLPAMLLACASPALAQDARDNDIFGAAPAEAAKPEPAAASTSNATMDGKLTDNMQVGGRVELRATANKIEGTTVGKGPLDQLRQADLFFDSRPSPSVRAFVRARFVERSGAQVTTATANTQELDELWIKTDWQRSVFFTTGKQHVKWGSGHLWNPTDFTAAQSKDPFDLFDRRLGQTMVKVHIPDEKRSFNYYAVAQVGDAKRNDDVGGALRGEFAFLGTGELALSLAARRGEAQRFGLDVSSALGPVDVYVEAAGSRHQTKNFYKGKINPATSTAPTAYKDEKRTFAQVVGGVTKTWKYSDDDNVTFGAEYFDNGLGYTDRNLAFYSLVNGQSQPLYVGRRYAGAYVTLPSPGAWNDTSFYLNGLRNLADQTAQVRLTGAWTFYKEATLDVFVSRCLGDYGELCFRVPQSYQALSKNPLLPPAQQQALAALPTKRTIAMAGAGFSMAF